MPLTDDENAFGYDCLICRELFATRLERNEHLQSHFIHKNCTDCDRPVIVIGDIEFELHRSLHCNVPNVSRESVVAVERVIIANERSNGEESDDGIVLKEEPTHFEDECNNDDQSLDRTTEMAYLPDDLAASIVAEKLQPAKPKKRQRKLMVKVKTNLKIDKETNDNVRKVSRLSKPTIHCTQDGCNEEFRQQRSFRMHLKNEHGIIERVHCPICNFGFTDKSNLKHHMILHGTDSRRFICNFCGAGKQNLDSIRNYSFFFLTKINSCHRVGFHKLTNMKEHMNAHLGLKV